MNVNVRKEEYAVLGDFVMASYARDLDVIKVRFPKFGDVFKENFEAKLNFVKALESGLVLREDQKEATASLYTEAGKLNDELNFVSSYFKDAGLNSSLVSALKQDLFDHNIEGALLKIEGLRQYIVAHLDALVVEGMDSHFPDELEHHRTSLSEKNNLQNEKINQHKELIDANRAHYDALYALIVSVAEKGKLVFKGTVFQDEYTISKVMKRMRAPGKKQDNAGSQG
jgi:hypothetical protein